VTLPPRSGGPAIRQIAALPYQIEGAAADSSVRLLLVTTRGSRGRWVIPKGNAGADPPHVSAAKEAEEEAGVRGAACPHPLGSFRYRKRRPSGASILFDVDVFPLAVTDVLVSWKEKDERERRWFSLSEAAEAVEEDDLRDLIRSFAPAEFVAATRRTSLLDTVVRKSRMDAMFGWFQRLLPTTGNFFEMFEAHAAVILAAADATARMLDNPGEPEHRLEIHEREHDADEISRTVLQTVRKTFLTPFDRGAIAALIGSMDDTIDEMQATASAIELYQVETIPQEMKDMVAIIVDAARVTAEAIPLLRDVGRNAGRLHELTERLVRMESHADAIHAAGLKRALREHGAANTLQFVVDREVYKHLERITDAFEDVADQIDGIVIEHA
jgi:predicted phosphate transport protein (TIGR00153 family)